MGIKVYGPVPVTYCDEQFPSSAIISAIQSSNFKNGYIVIDSDLNDSIFIVTLLDENQMEIGCATLDFVYANQRVETDKGAAIYLDCDWDEFEVVREELYKEE